MKIKKVDISEKTYEELRKLGIMNQSFESIITERMAYVAAHKLILELPNDVVQSLGGDIAKTWTYANLLAQYADKPLMREK